MYWWLEKRSSAPPPAVAPPVGSSNMGYGEERWHREHALWSAVVRRLEIQSKYQNPISERLQRELAAARAKVAEAATHIKQKS